MHHCAATFAGRATLALAILSLLFSGCSQQPALPEQFVLRPEVAELPARHREQLGDFLEQYFGTPLRPRMMAVEAMPEEGQEGPALVDRFDRDHLAHGREVFTRRCAGCHGPSGDGNGPAAKYLDPKPRDYRQGKFKFTSTSLGSRPLKSDLARIIRRGAKGTSMPAFRWLSQADLDAVIDYVILLSQRGELEQQLLFEAEDELDAEDDFDVEVVADYASRVDRAWEKASGQVVLPATHRPPYDDASIRLGKEAFLSKGCAKCHGADGRGHTQENVGKDAWGNTVKAADLTSGMLHGGRRPIDVYRRVYAGINGTPMPGFAQALQEEPDTVWHLVHYVLALVEGRQPVAADAVAAMPADR